MIAQINELIDINLLLLSTAVNHTLPLKDFQNHHGMKLHDANILAEIMELKDLIRLHCAKEMRYELTDFGKQVSKNGGWLLHLENLKKETGEIQLKISEHNQNVEKKMNSMVCFTYIQQFFLFVFSSRKQQSLQKNI